MRPTFIATILLLFGCLHISASSTQNIDIKEAKSLIRKADDIIYHSPEQAIFYAVSAIQILPDDNNNTIAEAMLVYALGEKLLGNFDSSIKILFDALKHIEHEGTTLRGEIYSLIGVVYSSLTDYNKAIEYNDRATSIFKASNDSVLLASSLNNRGLIHYNLDEFRIAEQFFMQSLSINRSLKRMKEIAANLNNLCLYKGDFKEKLKHISEAIAINKNLDAQWSLGENYNNLGKQYFFNGDYGFALEALATAQEISNKIGAKELICDNYEYHSWVYKAMNDYENAYNALEQLHLLNQELQSSNKLKSVELEISNKNLQDQKRLTDIKEQRYKIELLKRNLILLIVLLIFLTLASIFTSKWYRRKKAHELINAQYNLEKYQREVATLKIDQQNSELANYRDMLEIKRREMTEFAVFIQSQNDILDNIREKIKEGYSLKDTLLQKHLKQINLFISQYQNSKITNNNMLINIEQRNLEFRERLLKKHNSLTKGELDLASLLLIDLSTKDISIITGRSIKTINMSRYRLRKSLELTPEQNLSEYLQSI